MTFQAALVIVGALGGGLLTAIATGLFNRTKVAAEAGMSEAQAADILTRAATDLLTVALASAKEQEQKLSAEIADLRTEVVLLRGDVEALTAQLIAEGIRPALPGRGPNGRAGT